MSQCGVILGVMGWISSLWISLVGGQVVQLVYPPMELGQDYALGTVEVPGREVAGRSPLELLGGFPFEQVWCCVAARKMAKAWAWAGRCRGCG